MIVFLLVIAIGLIAIVGASTENALEKAARKQEQRGAQRAYEASRRRVNFQGYERLWEKCHRKPDPEQKRLPDNRGDPSRIC